MLHKTDWIDWQAERNNLDRMLGEHKTLREISKHYGVSRERVRQVIKELGLKTKLARIIKADGRICTTCKQFKPWAEFHHNRNKCRNGRAPCCIACTNEAHKHWRRDNPERCNEISRAYRLRHPDKHRAAVRAYYYRQMADPANRAAYNKRMREYRREKQAPA